MAKQEVEIYFKVEGLDGYITDLNELKGALGGITTATDDAKQATKELESAVEEDFSKLESRIDTTEGAVKVLAGSFEILAGAASLLGVEDNEFFKSLEENVVGVIALSEGAINVAEGYKLLAANQKLATIAQQAFNTVAKANPYVLLAGAVIALAGAVALYATRTQTVVDNSGNLNDALNDTAKALEDNLDFQRQLNIARGQGSDEATLKFNTSLISQLEEQRDAKQKLVEGLVAERQATGELNDEQRQNLNTLLDEQDAITDRILGIKRQNIILEQQIATENQQEADRVANEKKQKKRDKEQEERDNAELARIQAIALAEQQAAETLAIVFDEQAALEEELYRGTLTQRELAFRDLEDDYYRQLNLANENEELKLEIERQYGLRRQELNQQFADEDIAIQNERNQALIDAEIALQDAKFNAASAGFQLLSTLAGENEKLQNVIFLAEKGAAIAKVIVDSARAKIANLAYAATLGPVGPAYLAAANQAVNINTAASIATIAATAIGKFMNGGGTTPSTQQTSLPSPGASINYSFGQQAGGTIQPGQLSAGTPIQTYVLASDVTNAQQAQQQIQNLAKL